MIEDYYDIITKIEHFVDGLMIVDENGIIKYNRSFANSGFPISEKRSVGKTPMDIFPNLSEEDSTLYRALKYGETTVNKIQKLRHFSGKEITVIDNTFPVMEDGKIIGAVSTSKYIDDSLIRKFINLSNMTTTYTKHNLYSVKDIIGNSNEMRLLKRKIHMVSRTNSTVLIYGETGTGKELVAQSIHSHSPRKEGPFISQNCAAIPHTLLESIFFGTTKGSYTGAEDKPGIFELADGGTILLDEINSMDLNMQAKLLRAVEEKKVTRIGGSESKKMNVRIIAAMNKVPQDCLVNNTIREDLYYRLSSIQIKVPPLRDRKSDIEELTEHFIQIYNREIHTNIEGVSDEVLEVFKNYHWPGNVREFKNVIESAFNFACSNIIEKEDLPETLLEKPIKVNDLCAYEGDNLVEALEVYEKNFILYKAKGVDSLSELADKLQISKQTLNYKIKKYNLRNLI
ncbi:MAG TPA: sigma 54-interacting transcriptional regulator [Thermoanaerobacterales bacterium]|nr:sigma 54-interacting transcriptional regulator [Thermoanaerobacterales bacterium]